MMRSDSSWTLRINVLALSGAALGVLSMFTVWVSKYEMGHFFDWSKVGPNDMIKFIERDFLDSYANMDVSNALWLPFTLFIIGTVVAFVSPLGGIIQASGILSFFLKMTSASQSGLPSEVGAYIGIMSAIMVLAGLVRPLGFGYRSRPTDATARVVTVSPAKEKTGLSSPRAL